MAGQSLSEAAIKLSKTPLGIIALFVLLAEAIASIVLGTNSGLVEFQKTILVCFISTFPVLIVLMFWHLVVKHNTKLYSPSEFESSDDFLTANKIDPSRLVDEMRKEFVKQIEEQFDDPMIVDKLTRGSIKIQEDFEAAIDVVENPTTTNAELAAIKVIVNDAVTLQEAEAQVGVNVIAKLVKKQLVSRGSLAAGAVGASMAATELAKLISRLF